MDRLPPHTPDQGSNPQPSARGRGSQPEPPGLSPGLGSSGTSLSRTPHSRPHAAPHVTGVMAGVRSLQPLPRCLPDTPRWAVCLWPHTQEDGAAFKSLTSQSPLKPWTASPVRTRLVLPRSAGLREPPASPTPCSPPRPVPSRLPGAPADLDPGPGLARGLCTCCWAWDARVHVRTTHPFIPFEFNIWPPSHCLAM